MERISIESFVDKLNSLENKEIELNLKGIIETKLEIKFNHILKTKDYIEIISEKEDNIKLNVYQIMKIDIVSDNEFLVQFDALQSVNIIIKKTKSIR